MICVGASKYPLGVKSKPSMHNIFVLSNVVLTYLCFKSQSFVCT